MSMNIYINKNKVSFDCWQTPSQITYMILTQANGKIAPVLKGAKAKHAIEIYKTWVKFSSNGVYQSEDERNDRINAIKLHLHSLEEFIENGKNLEIGVM